MSAVFKRELRSYFNSMTGWIFLAVIFVFTGVFTTAINLLSQSASFEYVLSQITIVFMLIVPILAMRSIAEERRSRTDQLLYSLPLRAVDIVLGKLKPKNHNLFFPQHLIERESVKDLTKNGMDAPQFSE